MTATILSGPRVGSNRRAPVLEPGTPRWLLPLATAVAVLPIVVATIRALAADWMAIGDNANFLIRSRDVLTAHHPLLGTWSSASNALDDHVNHPGPLMFDLFAIPVKLAGSGGLAVGAALVAIASVIAIAVFAHRAGGVRLALAGLAAAAALAWTMTGNLLYDPWNPHVVLLPFLLLLVLAIAMAAGDTVALPVAAGVASLVVQTHLTYAALAPAVCLVGVVLLVVQRRREVTRAAVVTVVVLAIAWAQPIADQLGGEGNLGTLLGGAGAAEDLVGPELGAQVAADVLSTPPFWARPSFEDAYRVPTAQPTHVDGVPNVGGLPTAGRGALSLALLAVALLAALVVSHRRGDRVARDASLVGGAAVGLAVVAVVTQPLSLFGLTGHQLRYLWPIGIVATMALAVALTRRRWPIAVPLVAIGLFTATNLTSPASTVGPANDVDVIPALRELTAQLDDLEVDGPLLYDTREIRLAEPWTSALMAALLEDGVDLEVDEEYWVRQLGDRRKADGDARERIYTREGEDAEEVPTGARRVAHVAGLEAGERRELERLKRELADVEVELTDAGRRANELNPLPYLRDAEPDVEAMVDEGWLSVYVQGQLVTVPPEDRADAERYADLWYRWNRLTVSVYVEPLD